MPLRRGLLGSTHLQIFQIASVLLGTILSWASSCFGHVKTGKSKVSDLFWNLFWNLFLDLRIPEAGMPGFGEFQSKDIESLSMSADAQVPFPLFCSLWDGGRKGWHWLEMRLDGNLDGKLTINLEIGSSSLNGVAQICLSCFCDGLALTTCKVKHSHQLCPGPENLRQKLVSKAGPVWCYRNNGKIWHKPLDV